MSTAKITETNYRGHYRAVVMGASAGGIEALITIFAELPADIALSVLVVQHLHRSDNGGFAQQMAFMTDLRVIEAFDKERIKRGHVYIAPANYHMLVEMGGTISLSVDEHINWSRPSIDVLFESAADVWRESVAAVILSGSSVDGAHGMQMVKAAGGLTIAQDPAEAKVPFMVRSAIDTGAVDRVLEAKKIGGLLAGLNTLEDATQSTKRNPGQRTRR